ncbi:hypothetical protein HDK64DRAFT_296940 [Phyllosticta capitalensis]
MPSIGREAGNRPGPISEEVHKCLESFDGLKRNALSPTAEDVGEISISKVSNAADRFRLWVGNIGAHRKDRGSLDFRLRDAPLIQSNVLDILSTLSSRMEEGKSYSKIVHPIQTNCKAKRGETISNYFIFSEASAILQGRRIPFEKLPNPDPDADSGQKLDSDSDADSDSDSSNSESSSEETELDQLMDGTEERTSMLLRISMVIRNPARRDHSAYSNQAFTSHFDPYDKGRIQDKFKKAHSQLVERLASALSARRKFPKYQKERRYGLSAGLEISETDGKGQKPAPSIVASSIPAHMKDAAGWDLSLDNLSESGVSATSFALSFQEEDSSEVRRLRKTPRMPEEGRHGKPFECPICFCIIPGNEGFWKKHVSQDLAPYICTFESCSTPFQRFERCRDWFEHEVNHRSKWRCPKDCGKKLDTRQDLFKHLSAHPELGFYPELPPELSRACQEKPDYSSLVDCPLCGENIRLLQLQSHLGKHQYQLALYILRDHLEDTSILYYNESEVSGQNSDDEPESRELEHEEENSTSGDLKEGGEPLLSMDLNHPMEQDQVQEQQTFPKGPTATGSILNPSGKAEKSRDLENKEYFEMRANDGTSRESQESRVEAHQQDTDEHTVDQEGNRQSERPRRLSASPETKIPPQTRQSLESSFAEVEIDISGLPSTENTPESPRFHQNTQISHHGPAIVESEEGTGATFEVDYGKGTRLELEKEAQDAGHSATHRSRGETFEKEGDEEVIDRYDLGYEAPEEADNKAEDQLGKTSERLQQRQDQETLRQLHETDRGTKARPFEDNPHYWLNFSFSSDEKALPTPKSEATYSTVTHDPGFGQEIFPSRRPTESYRSHRRKHRQHGSTTTQDLQPSVIFMDPPQGPPKDPPQGPLHSEDADSDSEGSRFRNRPRSPPIDTSVFATNLPTVVRNHSSTSDIDHDYQDSQAEKAKSTRNAIGTAIRDAIVTAIREEARRREREEKAKDEYYKKYEAGREDYRAEERARKVRERAEKERLEREEHREPVESDDYKRFWEESERAREAAREQTNDKSPADGSPAEYQIPAESLPAKGFAAAHTSTYDSSRADAYYEKLRERERRQTANERLDRDLPGRHMSMAERKQKTALLEAEVAVAEAEAEARVKKTKREIGRDSKGNLTYIRRQRKAQEGAGEDAQKRRVRIFNRIPDLESPEPADRGRKSEESVKRRSNEDEADQIPQEEGTLRMKSDKEPSREIWEKQDEDELTERRMELQMIKDKVRQEEEEHRIRQEEGKLKE